MLCRPFVPTPEQVVEDAVANARLSGFEVTEDVDDRFAQNATVIKHRVPLVSW